MTFVDRPLPASLELPTIGKLKKLANLRPRNHGQVNRVTRDIKEGSITAATNIGRDGNGEGGLIGYLEDLALCGQGLSGPHITQVNVVSVPSDTYLSPEDVQKLQGGEMPTIEHTPQPVEAPIEPEAEPVTIENLKAELRALGHDKLLELARALDVGQ